MFQKKLLKNLIISKSDPDGQGHIFYSFHFEPVALFERAYEETPSVF